MKKAVSQLSPEIITYSQKLAPLSINPTIDGSLKLDILDTLNNKANSTPYLKLSSEPSPDAPAAEIGNNGEYYILLSTPNLVFVKAADAWSGIDKVNTMFFFNDSIDGVRRYYAFDDALENVIQVHSIDFGNPGGESVKYTPQILTTPQKTQARLNIDAASQAYIDNAIAALKNSGAIGNSVAGSVMPWFGTDATIPQDWAKINTTQTWYSKTEYAQLYQALGGENNPFGLTSTTFSIPWFNAGTSTVQSGGAFVRGTNGGAETVTLTANQSGLRAHKHRMSKIESDNSGASVNALKVENTDHINASIVETDDVAALPALESHNNMPPFAPAMWIIKLKNTGGSFTSSINENGHLILTFDDGTTQDAGSVVSSNPTYILSIAEANANISIPIPVGTWIRDINVFVISGNPTINIPSISSGDMNGQDLYPNSANLHFALAGNLEVNVSGGTVKIQIIKYNI